jgi:peptidoglycan/LPS O-acetylase OafA/YrhL
VRTGYDDYPLRIVALNLVEVLAAALVGAVLVAQLGWWAILLYALVGISGLILSLVFGCTRCHYHGRVCGLGLGRIAALWLAKRNEEEFGRSAAQTLAWTLVGLALALPIVAGLLTLSAGRHMPGLAVLVLFLAIVVAIVLTHSRVVCGRCRQAADQRCTLGRPARRP